MVLHWDLEKLLALAGRQWFALIAGIFFGVLSGVLYMHLSTPAYTVSIQVVPAPASLNSAPKGGLSELAGGILGGDSNPNSFKIYTSGLQSHAVAEIIAHDQAIMRRMYSDQWSDKDHAWKPNYGRLHTLASAVAWGFGVHVDGWRPPSSDDVYTFLQNEVDVLQARDTPVVTVTLQSRQPRVAADFLRILIADVDMLTRERALNRADEYIDYIGRELPHVTVTEYRAALIDQLNDQEKTRIMASATKVGYSADVFSGPTVSQRPTSPKFVVTLIISVVAGGFFGLLLGFLFDLHGRVLTWPWKSNLRVL